MKKILVAFLLSYSIIAEAFYYYSVSDDCKNEWPGAKTCIFYGNKGSGIKLDFNFPESGIPVSTVSSRSWGGFFNDMGKDIITDVFVGFISMITGSQTPGPDPQVYTNTPPMKVFGSDIAYSSVHIVVTEHDKDKKIFDKSVNNFKALKCDESGCEISDYLDQ